MAAPHTLSVCRTCPRYGGPRSGLVERIGTLAEAEGKPDGFRFMLVECLGGCPHPSAAALDAPGKYRLRFTNLTAADAADLFAAARAYLLSPDGDLRDNQLPAGLRGRISARSPKHPNRAAALGTASRND